MNSPKILYDDDCGLCGHFKNFVESKSGEKIFTFIPLNSPTGLELLKSYQLSESGLDSIVFTAENHAHIRSDAAIEIFRRLPGLWKGAVILRIFPRFLRDWVYNFIAKNRHRFFAGAHACGLRREDRSNP